MDLEQSQRLKGLRLRPKVSSAAPCVAGPVVAESADTLILRWSRTELYERKTGHFGTMSKIHKKVSAFAA